MIPKIGKLAFLVDVLLSGIRIFKFVCLSFRLTKLSEILELVGSHITVLRLVAASAGAAVAVAVEVVQEASRQPHCGCHISV